MFVLVSCVCLCVCMCSCACVCVCMCIMCVCMCVFCDDIDSYAELPDWVIAKCWYVTNHCSCADVCVMLFLFSVWHRFDHAVCLCVIAHLHLWCCAAHVRVRACASTSCIFAYPVCLEEGNKAETESQQRHTAGPTRACPEVNKYIFECINQFL